MTSDPMPSGAVVSKTDAAMARTERGLCLTPTCLRLADASDGLCLWCRRKENER